jgi:hypothetical protein
LHCIAQELHNATEDPLAVINRLFKLDKPLRPRESRRHHTFTRIVAHATILLSQHPQLHRVNITAEDGVASKDDVAQILAWHLKLYDTFCHSSAQRIAALLCNEYTYLVIGFDECRHLNEATFDERSLPSPKMSLIALQRIIKAADHRRDGLGNFALWFTLLDTSSSVFDLVPRRGDAYASSARLAGDLDPVPIWPYLGYDQMATKNCDSSSPQEATEVRRLLNYGRPVSSAHMFCFGVLTPTVPAVVNRNSRYGTASRQAQASQPG